MSTADPLGPEPRIHPGCSITATRLGRFTEVGEQSVLLNSELGAYSYCGRLCDIANTTVESFSNIASLVRIGATDHPLDRVSMHHFQYRSARYWPDAEDDDAWFEQRAARRTTIGHDTWLGHAAQVKPGVTVGVGAVVAAGAVVTKDVAPYTIVAGVPAAPLRVRFPAAVIDRLLALAWWDWPHETLRARLDDFRQLGVAEFLDKYGA